MLFGGLFVFLGMFLGVPVFSVIYMLARRLVDSRLTVRGLPTDEESYADEKHPLLRPAPGKGSKEKKTQRRPRSHFTPKKQDGPPENMV